MQVPVIISQTLLYLCFSVLLGSFLVGLAPSTYRPAIISSRRLLLICTIGIPLFAFLPVLEVILYLVPRLGAANSFLTVLGSFTTGKAWGWTLVLAVGLLVVVLSKSLESSVFNMTGTALTVLLIMTVAWSSHASAIDPLAGFVGDAVHLLAVSVWTGILGIVSWRSTDTANWRAFLTWFTPVAALCFVATLGSGLLMMDVLIDGYVASWVSPYGQGLLVKHLFIIPLLFYACLNGLWMNRKLKSDPGFNPKPWAQLESILIFIIFTITAVFSQLSPPSGNSSDDSSRLFMLVYGQEALPATVVQLEWNAMGILLLLLSVAFVALLTMTFVRQAPRFLAFLLSCALVLCLYLSLMTSIVLG
ncbi:MAG: copper resistance D family protein [Lysinibacillus sp.]